MLWWDSNLYLQCTVYFLDTSKVLQLTELKSHKLGGRQIFKGSLFLLMNLIAIKLNDKYCDFWIRFKKWSWQMSCSWRRCWKKVWQNSGTDGIKTHASLIQPFFTWKLSAGRDILFFLFIMTRAIFEVKPHMLAKLILFMNNSLLWLAIKCYFFLQLGYSLK